MVIIAQKSARGTGNEDESGGERKEGRERWSVFSPMLGKDNVRV